MTEPLDERFVAAIDLIKRTGADEVQIRFSDEEQPVVWMVVAHWPERDMGEGSEHVEGIMPEHHDAAAGLSPWQAMLRFCEQSMDGGTCRHCGRMTSVDENVASPLLDAVTGDSVCWYRYDPELKTFRRACEGVTP